jgi:hypothetical protein
MSKTIKVKIEIDVDELRHWADRHADAGHHGVAHALYKAAEGIESLTEQALREARETRVPEPLPVVAHKADGETDAEFEAVETCGGCGERVRVR